jgi:hypothetical protein
LHGELKFISRLEGIKGTRIELTFEPRYLFETDSLSVT